MNVFKLNSILIEYGLNPVAICFDFDVNREFIFIILTLNECDDILISRKEISIDLINDADIDVERYIAELMLVNVPRKPDGNMTWKTN
jgi:hypothetical protein